MLLINRDNLNSSIQTEGASPYGYLPLFCLITKNTLLFDIFIPSSMNLVYDTNNEVKLAVPLNNGQNSLNFTFVPLNRPGMSSNVKDKTEVARWLSVLDTTLLAISPDMNQTAIPWSFLRKNLLDLYLVRLRYVTGYTNILKNSFATDISQQERFRIIYQWELAYYFDREALASITGANFTNRKLASYFDFDLEPLAKHEGPAHDGSTPRLLPRSFDNQIYNYYERGILIYGLLRLCGMPAKAILQEFSNSVFLIPQTTVCNNVYVIENSTIPIVSYQPVLAIFNYYLDASAIEQANNSLEKILYFLNGTHTLIRKHVIASHLSENWNKSLDSRQFLCFAVTHQPWFFCSLMPLMQKMWSISLLNLFQEYSKTDAWLNVIKSFPKFEQIDFYSLFLTFLSVASNDFSANLLVFDNVHKNFEEYFTQSNIEPQDRQRCALLFMRVIYICAQTHLYDTENMRKFYLPNPNWCSVSIGWFQNRSSFAVASLVNLDPIRYHAFESINFLENLFRLRVRRYFRTLLTKPHGADEIKPALNFDAIYNREFNLNGLFEDSNFSSFDNEQGLRFSFLNEYSISQKGLQDFKIFSYQHVYLAACFSQYFRAMRNWFGYLNFFYGNAPIEMLNEIYFTWYKDQYINELSNNPCYEHPSVDFVGYKPTLLSYPKKKLPKFILKFNYGFGDALRKLVTKHYGLVGAPLMVSFQLSAEPIALPSGNQLYDSVKVGERTESGPEPLLFTDQISAVTEEFYLEAPNHLNSDQVLANNDRLLECNPTLALRTHGVLWYLLNQLEFLEWNIGREMKGAGLMELKDEPFICDWIFRRFQEVLLSQIEFDVTGQFRLQLRQPLSQWVPQYCGLLVLSNLPINGIPSLLTIFGTDPEPLAVLVVVMERLATNFMVEAHFAITVADQFLKFQRENNVLIDPETRKDDSIFDAFEPLAFNFECAPMGFPLTLEEIGYVNPNDSHCRSLFFDHFFCMDNHGKVVPIDDKIYPYNLVSRMYGCSEENLLRPYATAVKTDLDHFTLFLRHVGELFYGPDFVNACYRMASKKLVLAN